MLLQIAFDIFDTNQDGKISELDLFKLVYNYNSTSQQQQQSTQADNFNDIFYVDICHMIRLMNNKADLKYSKMLV